MNEKEFKLLEKQVIAEESKINRIELTIYSNENKIDKYASLISVSQKTKLKNQLIQLAKKIEKLNISSDKKILKTDSNATKKQIKHATGIKVRIIKVEIRKAKKQLAMMNAVNVTKLKKSIKDLKEQNVANAIEIAKLQSQAKPIFKQYTKAITLKKSKDLDIAISAKNVNAWYGSKQSLHNINIDFPKNKIIAIIGPSGCGKSTFLRTMNRINDEVPIFRAEGQIILDSKYDIFSLKNIHNSNDKITLPELRTKVGMIFQQPNPFPISIENNIMYGPKINGVKNKLVLDHLVKKSLEQAALWDEVKDNLKGIGTGLSGGQQQRLCIARAVANRPEILLMDEPTSALDPIAAAKVEELILELKEDYTIIMVTHSMQQAARISDYTAFFYEGELIEYGKTSKLFANPKQKRTSDYIRGRFG